MANGTEYWFAEYARRMMFRKLGYSTPMNELMADEAEWLIAVDAAFGKARTAMGKLEAARGKKNIRN